MTEMPTVSAKDMVSTLTADNLLLENRIAGLTAQLDEAMIMIEMLIWAGADNTPGCDCIWCGNVDEARDLLDQRAVAQAFDLLERGVEDEERT